MLKDRLIIDSSLDTSQKCSGLQVT